MSKWDNEPLDGLVFTGRYRDLVGQRTVTGKTISHSGAKLLNRRLKAQRTAIAQKRPQEAAPVVPDPLPGWDGGWHRKPKPEQLQAWEDIPEDYEEPIEDLLSRKVEESERYARKHATKKHEVRLEDSGPYGIMCFGDQHLDNPGTDMAALVRHVRLAQDTPHCYGMALGDAHDNWVGRLQREYAKSTTSTEEGEQLGHWFFSSIPWLAVVGGNHDHWKAGSVFKHMCRDAKIAAYDPHNVDVEITAGLSPFRFRFILRHSFRGNSQWNKVHAANKAHMMSKEHHHLHIQGHTHTYAQYSTEYQGRVCTSVVVAGYKTIDDYASACGFTETVGGHALFVLVDPRETDPWRAIRYFWDPEQGAAELRRLRGL